VYWNPYIRIKLAFFLLALLCLMMASNMVFIHKHHTASGGIIIHIHPYNLATDPENTGHHRSSSEIFKWDAVAQNTYLQPSYAQSDFSLNLIVETERLFTVIKPPFQDLLGLSDLRAPPRYTSSSNLN